jgi:hypothetical protein
MTRERHDAEAIRGSNARIDAGHSPANGEGQMNAKSFENTVA